MNGRNPQSTRQTAACARVARAKAAFTAAAQAAINSDPQAEGMATDALTELKQLQIAPPAIGGLTESARLEVER